MTTTRIRRITYKVSAIAFGIGLITLFSSHLAKAQWATSGSGDAYNNNSSGKVGIGVSSSLGTRLTVGRDLEIDSYTDVNSTRWGLLQAFDRESSTARPLWLEGSKFFFNGGNVGIGTTSPSASLHVFGSGVEKIRFDRSGVGYGTIGITGAMTGSSADLSIDGGQASTGMIFQVRNSSNSQITAMGINRDGNVGIGTTNPTSKLQVAGDGKFTGSLTVDGNIKAKYQDVAEWVESSEQLAAGTVVVLDSTKSNQVISSTQSYDTRVAGVISAQPGITLGESGDSKVLVATTGRVKVKVDATKSPIQIGDLLVTGDVPGVAMKSEAVNLGGVQIHRPGTLIGKALEPLAKGKGEILVLLSMQ